MNVTMKSWLMSVCALVFLFGLGNAATTVDDAFCGVEDHHKTCCESNDVVDGASVEVTHFAAVGGGKNDGDGSVLISWQPVEALAAGHIQYEVLLTETNGRGSCQDLTMMPKPCEALKGGVIVNEPSIIAISPDSSYMCRIRVLSNGVPVGLSICLDREDVDQRHFVLGDTGRSPKSLLPLISFNQQGMRRVRRQEPNVTEITAATESPAGTTEAPSILGIAIGIPVGIIVIVGVVIGAFLLYKFCC